jgi:hypothetical protein
MAHPDESSIAEAVEQAKREILRDREDGTFGTDVTRFSDLHEYVDANEYGGLCHERAEWPMTAANEVQERLDRWIRGGGLDGTP